MIEARQLRIHEDFVACLTFEMMTSLLSRVKTLKHLAMCLLRTIIDMRLNLTQPMATIIMNGATLRHGPRLVPSGGEVSRDRHGTIRRLAGRILRT